MNRLIGFWWSVVGAAVVALLTPAFCGAGALTASQALDRRLEGQGKTDPSCSDQTFAVQIDASLPTLKKRGTLTGAERIIQPGRIVYQGLRYTGDNFVKTQVMARFLARQTNPAKSEDMAVTWANCTFVFD